MNKTTLMARVWADLSPINVNEHVERKGNLSYLSWTWAWSTLKSKFPESYIRFKNVRHADDSMTVECWLTIHDKDEICSGNMWLPVMDHRNKAITNPNARDISDARMRCLVKCIAVTTGLGLYIYAGESVPQAEKEAQDQPIDQAQAQRLNEMLDYSGADVEKFLKHYGIQSVSELPQSHHEQAYKALAQKIAKMEADDAQAEAVADADL